MNQRSSLDLLNPFFPLTNLKKNEEKENSISNEEILYYNKIKEKFQSRKQVDIPCCKLAKQTWLCCCLNETSDEVIKNVSQYIEKAGKVTNILKLSRYIEVLRSLILSNPQINLMALPTKNINYVVQDGIPLHEVNELNEKSLDILTKLDYEDNKNEKLAMNIVKSVI